MLIITKIDDFLDQLLFLSLRENAWQKQLCGGTFVLVHSLRGEEEQSSGNGSWLCQGKYEVACHILLCLQEAEKYLGWKQGSNINSKSFPKIMYFLWLGYTSPIYHKFPSQHH